MPDWASTFELTVPFADQVVRGAATYIALLLLMRVVGQRETGSLGITDVLVIVLVAEAAAPALHGDGTTVGDSMVVIVTILACSVATDALSYRWPKLGRIIKARPRPLIEDGELNRKVMRRELMSEEELESALRTEGVEDLSAVKRALIEPNGRISVFLIDGEGKKAPDPPPAL